MRPAFTKSSSKLSSFLITLSMLMSVTSKFFESDDETRFATCSVFPLPEKKKMLSFSLLKYVSYSKWPELNDIKDRFSELNGEPDKERFALNVLSGHKTPVSAV